MNKEEIERLLVKRSNLLLQMELTNKGYDTMINKLLTPELLAEITAINAERNAALEESKKNTDELEKTIKAEVLVLKEGVKVEGVGSAVYNKGRKSWDTESLEKRMKEKKYRWLENYFDPGTPYVTIKGA